MNFLRLLTLLLLLSSSAKAFSTSLRKSQLTSSSSSLSLFDAAIAETVASAAAIPSILVGTGSYLLSSNKEEQEEKSENSSGKDGEVDIYRDTLLRYAGYANEVGEAFAPLVPAVVVPASYGVAITYVIADTVDKFRKSIGGGKYKVGTITTCAIVEGFDALIWQLAASVALPGYTIHQVVSISVSLLSAAGLTEMGGPFDALPTVIGLATIPFIVKPLDELAEVGMDVTFRKLFSPYLESCVIDFDSME